MLKLEIIGIRNETDIRGNRRCIAEMEITFAAEVVGTETAYEVINQILCNAAADEVKNKMEVIYKTEVGPDD